MSELTKEELHWVRRVQSLLNVCPSNRLCFFTSGDQSVSIYDRYKDEEISALMERGKDFGAAADESGALLGAFVFPSNVHSTAG